MWSDSDLIDLWSDTSRDESAGTTKTVDSETNETGITVKKEKAPVQKSKKKETAKKDKVERVLDKFCEAISKSQQESDKLFVTLLEEKRMKLDHDLMEKEQEWGREG